MKTKKLIRIVNEESVSEETNNYYCEYSFDNGKKWSCEQMLICRNQSLHENVLWWINNKMYNGFEFIGVYDYKDIKDWEPWL